ncbi:GTP 3',8-cyclase MoaA [Paraflavitalea pollutisoli]|uniref:GTP 3',8-cyclase MoaA n=1 Tax=Paraflavitalea pollutisoli TaxID=3034143 RepID=UPI0023EB05EC|nr:GTP 3',8-cyclase MoaA [Paraflavitalea sp. H1-2-19X]
MLIDGYKRVHDYLRISLTDSCNLRCFYCMPDEKISCMPHKHLMQPEEIDQIASLFVRLGVKKIRLTGGEPLVRKEAADIIRRLGKYPVELTMTTNGIRLHEFADVLQEAGLRSVNISLDTLQRDTFQHLTRRDHFQQVYDNILLATRLGMRVKVNVVAMKGINDGEINDFVALTQELPLHIRFIEFMPFTGNHWEYARVIGLQEILDIVGQRFQFAPIAHKKHDTAKNFQVEGHAGTFAIISTMTKPFCDDCNRMRLTADGKMKNCLFSRTETDLLSALRQGLDIDPLIRECIATKAAERGGQITDDYTHTDPLLIENRSMIAIGG